MPSFASQRAASRSVAMLSRVKFCRAVQSKAMDPLFDDRLEVLVTEDLRRVLRWSEDRLLNIVTPLDIHLQRQMPGVIAADPALQCARKTVERIIAVVDEVRMLLKKKVDTEAKRV